MKLISLSIFLFGSLGLASLGINLNPDSSQKEIPKAFKENYLADSFSSGKYGNRPIIDQLYIEAMEQNIELKNLHSDLVTISAYKHNNLKDFNKYRRNNLKYFSEVNQSVAKIQNPELRQLSRDLFSSFEKQYYNGLSDLEDLNNYIEVAEDEVNDLHILLKLMSSMDVIETYQLENYPDRKSLEEVIVKYESLTKQLKQHMEVIPEG